MNIGIIDSDLLDIGTRHPNLALMKISAYNKEKGFNVELLHNYNNINDYDKVYLSKVFDFTKIPVDITQYGNLVTGGTGLYWDKSPELSYEIEHHMPDYHLYDEYIKMDVARGIKENYYKDFQEYSIGFATRGCFRKCFFCVNQKYTHAFRHAKVKEFYDPSRKYIYLWDDNIFAYNKWYEVFDELAELNRPFQFRQGLDIRLMTEDKVKVLKQSKWKGDYIFAFDDIKDKDLIIDKLSLWKKYINKTTKLYVFCGFNNDVGDVISTFERVRILMKFGCLPYIMRHENYEKSEYKGIYINLARWCNQPDLFKKKSFREFCEMNQAQIKKGVSSTMRYLIDLEHDHPDIAERYFNMKFEKLNQYSNKIIK